MGAGVGDHLGPQNPQHFQTIIRKLLFSIFFPLEGNFDIDARDGGGPFRTPKIQKILNSSKNLIKHTKKIIHEGNFDIDARVGVGGVGGI